MSYKEEIKMYVGELEGELTELVELAVREGIKRLKKAEILTSTVKEAMEIVNGGVSVDPSALILDLLQQQQRKRLYDDWSTTAEIVSWIGEDTGSLPDKKAVNAALYGLLKKELIEKQTEKDGTKPRWRLAQDL